jgi:uroporphyrinogen-III synthase
MSVAMNGSLGDERDGPLPAQRRRGVLVLRPEPGTSATVQRAEELGFDAISTPLFTIAPLIWDAPDPADHDALMFTSANALRHAGEALASYRALPAYAVGETTAAAARAAGFPNVRTGRNDAADLLTLMAAEGFRYPLHLAGREHRDIDHPALTITRRMVYTANPVAILPLAASKALADGAIALLHSPRAAALFAALAGERATIRIAAISPATAAAAGSGWATVAIAAAPTDAELLKAASHLA